MTRDAPRHLVLIGLMGAGKTSVGRECARRLGRGFVDVDELIVTQTGRSVPELFATIGEDGFRAAERAALTDAVASPDPLVIACGGGAMGDPDNRRTAREAGVVVRLTAPVATLAARVEADGIGTRPLLADGGATPTLTRLAGLREPAYGAAAHGTVDTADRSVAEVASAVLDLYVEAESQ